MRTVCSLAFLVSMACAGAAAAATSFNRAIDDIRARPEFVHSNFGVEIWSLDKNRVLYALNGNKLFVPGSTTKLLTEGTALKLFGPGRRFHTPVYRTAQVNNGVLKGNLVLVASGDPDLSGRAQPDGTLAFVNEDHSYGGFDSKLVGDPLAVLKDIARQVAASGIRKIDGQVLIDASLFPEGAREGGTNVVISPAIVNDNVVDILVTPGGAAGKPAKAVASPLPAYMRLVNKVKTGAADSRFSLDTKDETLDRGIVAVTVSGSIPANKSTYVDSYAVASPSRFAAALLVQSLENAGVAVGNHAFPGKPTGDAYKAWYKPENRVADVTSPPLSEDVKITLKVSQNLHAAVMPYDLGAILGNAKTKVPETGFHLEQEMLKKAGLDVSGASQGDGPGAEALFTPDFMVHYLAWWSKQVEFSYFQNGLPILGKDGTLWNIQTSSAAAGRVFAKTGTDGEDDLLNASLTMTGKGLAGYTTTPTGEHVAFAIFINNVPLNVDREDNLAVTDSIAKLGNVLGEIAADANTLPIESN